MDCLQPMDSPTGFLRYLSVGLAHEVEALEELPLIVAEFAQRLGDGPADRLDTLSTSEH